MCLAVALRDSGIRVEDTGPDVARRLKADGVEVVFVTGT